MNPVEKLPLSLLIILGKVAALFPKAILNIRFKRWTGRGINWGKPYDLQEYIFKKIIDSQNSEKINQMALLADKVRMRNFVTERIGDGHLPKLYGSWESASEIDWASLPNKFVVKTNNNCGTNIIVRDKTKLNIPEASNKLKRWLKFPYGELTGQPHYSKIKPLIFAEELLEEKGRSTELPHDYKFFCFNGKPRFILYYEGREINGHICFNITYDTQWNKLNNIVNKPALHDAPKPVSLALMTNFAEKLSKGFDFVRVDFYEINGRPIVGEMTFTPDVTTNFTPQFLHTIINEI